jgi:esterase/lipase superfamily enzyme
VAGWAGHQTGLVVVPALGEATTKAISRGATATGFRTDTGRFVEVKVHFATNRAIEGIDERGNLTFGNDRGELIRGRLRISIPPNHKPGKLEAPSVFRLELREDPERHVVLLDLAPLAPDAFDGSLASTLAATPGRKLMVYVHGFNNSFHEAARRTAQMAFDMSSEGVDLVPVLFSWPSGSSISPLEYNLAWTNKDWAKTDLAAFLLELRERSGAEQIFLVAHSLGTHLLANALERIDGLRCADPSPMFDEVVLAAPDIDAGTFSKVLAPALRRAAGRTTIYAARQDLALQVSEQVHGGLTRLGDSSSQVFVVPDMDTIDASDINISDIGHGYYAEIRAVLRDIRGVFTGLSAAARGLLTRRDPTDRLYWLIPRH